MSLLKEKVPANKGLRVVLVNQSEEIQKPFRKYDGKTLVEVDMLEDGKLTDITIGRKAWDGGDDIMNLVLHFKDKKVAFPLSRGFGGEVDNDPTVLLNGEFYLRKRMMENDAEGEPTGAEYISFGKPSGITFDKETSLVSAEEVAQ